MRGVVSVSIGILSGGYDNDNIKEKSTSVNSLKFWYGLYNISNKASRCAIHYHSFLNWRKKINDRSYRSRCLPKRFNIKII